MSFQWECPSCALTFKSDTSFQCSICGIPSPVFFKFIQTRVPKDDYVEDEESSKNTSPIKRPCKYGSKCYSTNPVHLGEYSHPQAKKKSVSDEEDEYEGNESEEDDDVEEDNDDDDYSGSDIDEKEKKNRKKN